MARILYAAAGDGFGHATRAHSVGAGLLARGHDVRFVTSQRNTGYLREHFPGLVEDIFGLSVSYNQGRVEAIPTVMQNIRGAWNWLGPTNRAVRRLLSDYRPDLVITDFEPFSAFWARRLGIAFISLDNHHQLTHCVLDHPPGFLGDRVNVYIVIRLYYSGAKRYLIASFFDTPIRHHPTTLIGPVLRPSVYKKRGRYGDFLLAYKGAGGENDAMRQALEAYDRLPIRAYGFGLTGVRGRVTFKPTSAEAFVDDLAQCAGVIATAGHSLVCECFYFDKPMLLIPIARQYEQIINAHYVQRQGAGQYVFSLDTQTIDAFVDQLETYRQTMSGFPKTSLDSVLDAVEREIPE